MHEKKCMETDIYELIPVWVRTPLVLMPSAIRNRRFQRKNLANAKFMNLELDDRPIEHKPSTKLLGVHIDEIANLE